MKYIKHMPSGLGIMAVSDTEQEGYEAITGDNPELLAYEKKQHNNAIYAKLKEIDLKSIRALRDGDTEYIEKYKQEAETERGKLL